MIYTLTCTECNSILAYSYTDLPTPDVALCYPCMENFCNMAETFGAVNVPHRVELWKIAKERTAEQIAWNTQVQRAHLKLLQTEIKPRTVMENSLTKMVERDRIPETFSQEIDK